jgi:hypothetical protein
MIIYECLEYIGYDADFYDKLVDKKHELSKLAISAQF